MNLVCMDIRFVTKDSLVTCQSKVTNLRLTKHQSGNTNQALHGHYNECGYQWVNLLNPLKALGVVECWFMIELLLWIVGMMTRRHE